MSFRGAEFLAPDPALEVWLKLIIDVVAEMGDVPGWLEELREDWFLQAAEHFGFGIVPDLDRYLVDEPRRRALLDVCLAAMVRLDALGDPLTVEAVNSVGVSTAESWFTRDDTEGVVRDTAQTFVRSFPATRSITSPEHV